MQVRDILVVLFYACSSVTQQQPAPEQGASDTPAPGNGAPVQDAPPSQEIPTPSVTGAASSCAEVYSSLIYTNGITQWTTINVSPSSGMQGIADAIASARSQPGVPVRILLSPGVYLPEDEGQGDFFVEDLTRTATSPVLIEASDKTPNATRVGQGFVLINTSYMAFDGISIGPASLGAYSSPGECGGVHAAPHALQAQAGIHVAGAALNPNAAGVSGGHIDWNVYGRFTPASHILVRRVTIQNIHGNDEPSGAEACGGGSDGIKFNQAEDVVVIDSSIRQVSRHGIDNVGVHRGVFCNNTISDVGQGLGIEAKGGSVDIVFDANVFVNVRRVEIGGEMTDAAYYWSAETPGTLEHYAYEARRLVARNNIVIDPREAGFELSGCHDCAITGNTVLYRAGADGTGDVLREVDSAINAADDAGRDCGEVENCWHAGSHPADIDGKVLSNARNSVSNNLFLTADVRWGSMLNPFNHPNGSHAFSLVGRADYNLWWNAGAAIERDEGWLQEGAHTVYATGAAKVTSLQPVTTDPLQLRARVLSALRPVAAGVGSAQAVGFANYDAALAPRAAIPTFGALE